ncbi:MAG: AMP-binding protein [Deltaproteobacteria bacterium]|nr:AMP-binding protein [Deltaproteobacteria bacterium]
MVNPGVSTLRDEEQSCPLRRAARLWPERRGLVFAGRSWTYRELEVEVEARRGWLLHQGLGPGANVAGLAANMPETVLLLWALGRIGASLLPLNTRLADLELRALLDQSTPAMVLSDEACTGRITSARSLLHIHGEVGRYRSELPASERTASVRPTCIAASLFTSGTTGAPKLVRLSHGNFQASARCSAANLGAAPSDVWLGMLPLFHVGGLAMAYRCAVDGACLWLEPRFEASRAAALLSAGEVTHASFVPTALERVLEAAAGNFPASLRAILIGGGPMGEPLLARARRSGLPVLQTYGLTEACSQVATERPDERDGKTAGPALPGLEIEIRDAADRPAAPGVVGEIQVRGPTVHLEAGAWLKTGDLGSLDERGRLTPWARRADLIVSGGENISPAEVERVLAAHPLVRDAGVAPREDAQWGQVPVAVVVPAPGFDRDALLAFARSRLAGFKVPREVLCLEELPRNANGKLERARLRALVEGNL